MNSRSLYKLLLLTIAASSFTRIKADPTPESALVINEIMPANVDMFIDPSFNYGSWIELYNSGDTAIDISGWFLSNDPSDNRQCPLGDRERIIEAGKYLTLWFGHVEDYCPDQLDFDLDNSYDDHSQESTIILSDKNGNVCISESYPFIPSRISWARTTDGGSDWGYTGHPTPGATNDTCRFASEQLQAPVIDTESKLFPRKITVHVEIPEGTTVYYTTDGSLPAPDNPDAMVSTGDHTVKATTVFRFRSFKDGMLPSPVTTRSYIKTSNEYNIPVVSIVTDNDNLYSTEYGLWAKGPNGIDGNGQQDLCNWNRDWDRPMNIEIIDPNGNVLINQEAEMAPSGRWSRANTPHPFKIKAKKKYGTDNYFPFEPFSDKPYNKYKSLKMRSGGNSYTARLKDAALQEVLSRSGFNVDCQSYQPVHHYVNGVYCGVINFREPNNKDYAYSNYGYDDEEVDCFKIDHNLGSGGFFLTNGSRDAWDEWLALSKTADDPASYERICQIVDVEEFANYMAVEFFLTNWDWPINNIKAFRQNPDGRFRFIVFDLDLAFGLSGRAIDINPFTEFMSKEYSGKEYTSAIVTIFKNMINNDSFRDYFVNSFCIVACSVYDQSYTKTIVDELAARVKKEMAFSSESPDADAKQITNTLTADYRDKRITQLVEWSRLRLGSPSVVNKRISTSISQTVLTLNGQVIPTNKYAGLAILPAKVKVTVPQGYRFVGWKDWRNNYVSTDTEYELSSEYESIKAVFEADSTTERPVRINEVSAGNKVFVNESFKKNDWVELYNTTSTAIEISGMFLSDNLSKPEKYTIPDGTVIPANGYLVIWCDKESGNQIHANFKLDNKDENVIVLTASDHSWADTLKYRKHNGYQTVGLYPDGGSTSYLMNRPTIGKANCINSYDQIDKQHITLVKRIKYIDKKADIYYNLLGQPVLAPEPGQLYIKNGRKIYYRP